MSEIKWLIGLVLLMFTSQCLSVENVCPSCECGRINRNGKVLEDEDVQPNEFPWIATNYANDESNGLCTGSLINSKYILTTAFCVHFTRLRTRIDDLYVRLSGHNVNPETGKSSVIIRKVKRVKSHGTYQDNPNKYADIALVQLDKDVDFSNGLVPICLPRSDFNVNGFAAVAVCPEVQGRAASTKLRFTINDYDNCTVASYYNISYIRIDKLCAQHQEDTRCEPDMRYGDALQFRYNSTGAYHLAGMFSYNAAHYSSVPSRKVFSKISHHLKWISSNTRDACSCYAVNKSTPSRVIGKHRASIKFPSYRYVIRTSGIGDA